MLEASEASALSSPLLPYLPTKEEALAAGFLMPTDGGLGLLAGLIRLWSEWWQMEVLT